MRVLLIEDNAGLAAGLTQALRQRRVDCDTVPSAEAARLALADWEYDALVLDLGLPGQSGLDFLRWLKSDLAASAAVLILTARDGIPDRVEGLNSGADDFLVKPCDPDELVARLHAISRRQQGRESPVITHGSLQLDPARHLATFEGAAVDLAPREYRLLVFLLERCGRVQSRQQIENAMYGWGEGVESNSIEVHVHNLRKKFGDKLIETVRGAGYRIPERAQR